MHFGSLETANLIENSAWWLVHAVDPVVDWLWRIKIGEDPVRHLLDALPWLGRLALASEVARVVIGHSAADRFRKP